MGAGMLVLVGVAYGWWLSTMSDLKVSERLGDALKSESATRTGDVVMIDYKEPSLAFYQGGTIREESNNRFLIDTDPVLWPRWIVLTRRIWDALPRELRETKLERIETVEGWWYANGMKRVQVLIVRKR